MKLSKRGEAQPVSEKQQAGEKPKTEKEYKRSVVIYIITMFTVVILLMLLSYFMQQRNAKTINDITKQHKEFSTQALENIERLQEKNQLLLKETEDKSKTIEELKGDVSDLEKKLKENADKLEESEKEASKKFDALLDKYTALCKLIHAESALTAGDTEGAGKFMEELEPLKKNLDEEWLELYNNIAEKLN